MTSSKRRAAALCALLSTTCFVPPALAQAAPASTNIEMDERGVDVIDGSYNLTSRDVSVGPEGLHVGGLSFGTVYGVSGLSHSQRIVVDRRVEGAQTFVYLTLGTAAEKFLQTGSTYTPVNPNGATLTASVAGAVTNYVYTTRDGTEIGLSDNSGGSSLGIRVDYLLHPLGDRDVYTYKAQLLGGVRYERLQSVTNNTGWQLKFTYGTNILNAGTTADWQRIASVKAINNSVEYCAPAADACSLTNAWPEATYGSAGLTRTTTDPAGRTWTYTLDGAGRIVGVRRPTGMSDAVSITYDGAGRVATLNEGGTWTYAYADVGGIRTTTVTNPLSQTIVYTADLLARRIASITDGAGKTVQFQYDGSGRLTRQTNPEGDYIQYSYDARGNVTEERRVAKAGSGIADIVTTASFDATCANRRTCNKPNSVTDARGNVTTFTYHAASGALGTTRHPALADGTLIKNFRTHGLKRARYLDASGLIVDAPSTVYRVLADCYTTLANCMSSGERTAFDYVATSNLLAGSIETSLANGSQSTTTTYGYDAVGNRTLEDGPLAGTADTTRYRYNAARQLVGEISADPDGAGPLKHRARRLNYDGDGLVASADLGTVDSQSDADWPLMATLESATTGYDSIGRRTREELVSGATTYQVSQFSYDAAGRPECDAVRMNPAAFVSLPASACTQGAAGSFGPDRITRRVHDAAGRVATVQSGYGTAQQFDEAVMTYADNGRPATLTDGNGNRTTFEYDGHDRLAKTRYPSPTVPGTSSTTDFDQTSFDPNGNATQLRTRDGQIIGYSYDVLNRQTAKDLPGAEPDATYAYDLRGRLTQASQGGHVRSLAYNAQGDLITATGPLGAIAYQYDAAGRRTRVTWPDGFFVTYEYLLTGEVSAVRENGAGSGAGVLAVYAYDDRGRRTALTRGNGTGTSYSYDPVSRLASLSHDLAGTGNDVSWTLGSYNPAGQMTSVTRSNDLFAWGGHYNMNSNYSANGLNQYTAVGAIAPTYDGRGNLTADGVRSYGYSSENLPVSASGGVTLAHDPLLRLYQVAGAGTARFAYDGPELIAEHDGANALQRRFVHGADEEEPLVWYEGSGTGDRRWLHADERGSIVAVSDGGGALTAINRYDEYGVPQGSIAGRFGYTGQPWSAEVGLHDFGARFYGASLGRFLQPDPSGYDDGTNLYAYVVNDPVNLVDPTGLEGQSIVVTATLMNVGNLSSSTRVGAPRGDPEKMNRPQRPRQRTRLQRLGDCTLDQLGIQSAAGASSVVAGQPIPGTKPYVNPGSSRGTSAAGMAMNRTLGNRRFPGGWRAPTPVGGPGTGRAFQMAGTRTVGRAIARWIPFIGWAILAYDAVSIAVCTARD